MVRLFSMLAAALAALLLATPAAAQAAPAPAKHRFLHLSDLHFDPFADPALVPKLIASPPDQWEAILAAGAGDGFPAKRSHGYEDSNYALVRAALAAAAAQGPYDYILFTGDYLAHDYQIGFQKSGAMPDYAAFTAKSVAFINLLIRKTFPNTPLIAALGNNDSDCGDYRLRPNSPLLTAMGETLPLVAGDPDALASLAAHGSYVVPHPTIAKRDVIAFDDVPLVPQSSVQWAEGHWASTTNNYVCATPQASFDSIGWLVTALEKARAARRTVTLVLHIPPGVDNFQASQNGCPNGSPLLLDQNANAALVGLISGYSDVIRDVYAGHTHMDDFRVLLSPDGTGRVPIRIAPSVSPYFGNIPAFTAFDYDPAGGRSNDYAVRTIASIAGPPATAGWPQEYRFTGAYRLGPWGAKGLAALAAQIRATPTVRTTFGNFYESSPALNPLDAPGANWLAYACAETAMLPGTYSSCTCPAV